MRVPERLHRALDADRQLALSYLSPVRRARLQILWDLDLLFGTIVSGGTQPALSQIKLAWWREALQALDSSAPPAEPLLQALARDVLPLGIPGSALAEMAVGWQKLLGSDPLGETDLSSYAALRGGSLFRFSAMALGYSGTTDPLQRAGEGWALVDFARHSSKSDEARAAMAAARRCFGPRWCWPVTVRSLGMVAVLARYDAGRDLAALEVPGSPRRMARMLFHRLTGL